MTAILKVDGLESGYKLLKILHGVSIEVEKGSITSLIGSNGAGKTTTLRAVMGIINPWKGKVLYDGLEINDIPTHKKVEMGLTVVPEGRHLFNTMTVKQNLTLGAYTKKAREKLDDSLELVYALFPVLKKKSIQKAYTLSGGEQQMLTVARALMAQPKLMLLDEPSQGLAPLVVSHLMGTLQKIRDEVGITMLLVEQNVMYAFEIGDYAYVMDRGEIVLKGTPKDLIDMSEIRKAYLGI